MTRAELIAAVRPIADKLAKDIVDRLLAEFDRTRSRAVQLAREALELELDQEDDEDAAVAEEPTAKARPVRAPRSPRREQADPRVPRAARAPDEGAARRGAAPARADRGGAVARADAGARPKQVCKVCGEAGHNARTCGARASLIRRTATPPPARRVIDTSGPVGPAVTAAPPEVPSAHCKTPSRCSVCQGATARKVTIVRGEVQLDGASSGRRAMPGQDVSAPRSGRTSKKIAAARAADAARLAGFEADEDVAA